MLDLVNNNLLQEMDSAAPIDCKYQDDPSKCASILEYKNNHNGLTVLSLNIRSIHKNMDLFLAFLSSFDIKIDVIVLTECWTSKYDPPPIYNYNMIFTKNSLNQNDGVVAYVRKHYNVKANEPVMADGNCLVLEIDDLYSVVCSYRPPSYTNPTNYFYSLDNILHNLKLKNNVIFTGDININILESVTPSSHLSEYMNLMASHTLTQCVDLPTRVNTCLDHFMIKTNNPWKTLVFNELTDHSPVLLFLNKNPDKKLDGSNTQHKSISNINLIRETLAQQSWNEYYEILDANDAATNLISTVREIIQNNTTIKRTSNKYKALKPWINCSVIKCIRHRNRLQKQCKVFPNDVQLRDKFSKYRNICNNLIKSIKHNYYKNKLDLARGNLKETWKIIKEMSNYSQNKNSTAETLLNINTSPQESLNEVNIYFTSIGKDLASLTLNKLNKTDKELAIAALSANIKSAPSGSLSFFLTDAKEVASIICKLKVKSAPGWDNITTSLLKFSSHTMVEPIAQLCNLSFSTGVFPAILKKAMVCPIFKAGDKQLPSNYRPISLLPTLSKVIEKIANKRLMAYLEKNSIIASNQYGFRTQKSTDDAVLQLTTLITKHLDKGERCVGVFLDLQKAFDTVSIPILLARLEGVGVRGSVHDWFKDYLTDRKQQVKIDRYESDSASCNYGVPQGSTLGPSLFLIYINELCKAKFKNADIIMFADDTVLLFHGSSWSKVRQIAEEGLSCVISWLEDNLLSLNASKTKYICFKKTERNKLPPDFKIIAHSFPCNRNGNSHSNCSCNTLGRVESVKYLGVTIDHKMTWRLHIESVSKRIRKLIYVFKTLRPVADRKLLLQTYKALGECIISYCICSWGGAAKTYMIEVERAQRALLKVMMALPFRHPTKDLYESCKVLSVRKLFIQQSLKRYHTETVPFLHNTSKKRLDNCPVPKYSCALAWRHYNHIAPKIYNTINKKYKVKAVNSHKFKSIITDWLHQLDYDDVEKLLVRTV